MKTFGWVIASALTGMAWAMPQPLMAQAYQCALPPAVAPVRRPQPDGPVRNTPIARYTLAASWSPDHCKMSGDTSSMQCSNEIGRFGFILHGLWPDSANGGHPQWCATQAVPSPQLLRQHLCMTPSASLLAREWAKHGSCMVKTPEQYFKASSILWQSIRWPDANALSRRKNLTAGMLRDAFLAQNRAWTRAGVGIKTSSGGWLREVHLCYRKDFMPGTCPASQFGASDSTHLRIWRGQ